MVIMQMNKACSLLFWVFVLTLVACESNVDWEFAAKYEGDKLALSGFLSPDSVHVFVSKSTNPLRDFTDEDMIARNPKVFLLDSTGQIMRQINSKDQRKFRLGDAMLVPGQSYKIRAMAEGLKTVETDLITIPQLVLLEQPEYQLGNYGNDTVHQVRITFTDLPAKQYYTFGGALKKGTQLARPNILIPDKEFAEGCYNSSIFTDICYQEKRVRLTFLLFREARFLGEKSRTPGESIVVRFGLVSEQAFLQGQSIPIDEGIIEGVNEPPVAYSNVKNGYGVVYAYNVRDYPISFK
jgi:hypothetical protein